MHELSVTQSLLNIALQHAEKANAKRVTDLNIVIGELASIRTRNKTVIRTLRALLDRGIDAGVFRSDIEPVELHMSISALCFYNVSNRYTFSKIFDRDTTSNAAVAARREVVVDIILRWVAANPRSHKSASSR